MYNIISKGTGYPISSLEEVFEKWTVDIIHIHVYSFAFILQSLFCNASEIVTCNFPLVEHVHEISEKTGSSFCVYPFYFNFVDDRNRSVLKMGQ